MTFTATVTVQAPGAGTATGTVTFMDGATTVGTGTLTGGVAAFTTAALAVGHHNVTAVYGGDASFNASTSNTLDQEVQKADTTTSVTSSANPSVFGQSVTFTATVSRRAGSRHADRDGDVHGRRRRRSARRRSTRRAVATFTTAALAVGDHTRSRRSTAATRDFARARRRGHPGGQQGGHDDRRSSSSTESVDVRAVGDVHGDGDGHAPGAGTPTGTVTFMDGATTLGTGTLDAAASRRSRPSTLAVGPHTITAVYGGDASFTASTSSAAHQDGAARRPRRRR